MRSCLVLLSLGILVVGCGKRTEPSVATYTPPPVLHKWATPDTATTRVSESRKDLALQYAKDLEHEDVSVREEASRHLREMGEAGYPHLLAALKGPKPRLAALNGISPVMVHHQQKVLVPLLIELIKDKDPAVRKQVCVCLAWADRALVGDEIQAGVLVRERMAVLRFLAERDESREVQDTARDSLASVRDAAQGRAGAGVEPSTEVILPKGPDRPAPKRVLRP